MLFIVVIHMQEYIAFCILLSIIFICERRREKKLRILILNYEYPPLGAGAGVVTQHLAERLAGMGNHVYVLTTWYSGEPELSIHDNLSLIRVKARRKSTFQSNPFEMYSWMKAAFRYIRQSKLHEHIDITLANFTLPGGPVARFLKKKYGIPYVILSHGHDVPWYSPSQMIFWHMLTYSWIKAIMKDAYRNILLTDHLKSAADKFLGDSLRYKNVVIPNGMEINIFRSGFDSRDKTLKILFAGRLVDQKDPLTFLKVAEKLNALNIPADFTLVGDGPLRLEVERFISQHEISNITVSGKISQAELFSMYAENHLLIMPSKNEAMSLVALEALSHGMYLLSTQANGIDRILHPDVNGEWIEIGDVAQIVNTVLSFYKEKFLKNYQYPRELSYSPSGDHHWDTIAEKYEKVFREALKEK